MSNAPMNSAIGQIDKKGDGTYLLNGEIIAADGLIAVKANEPKIAAPPVANNDSAELLQTLNALLNNSKAPAPNPDVLATTSFKFRPPTPYDGSKEEALLDGFAFEMKAYLELTKTPPSQEVFAVGNYLIGEAKQFFIELGDHFNFNHLTVDFILSELKKRYIAIESATTSYCWIQEIGG